MPFRREQVATGTDTTFASTVSATLPNPLQAGSLILLAWEGDTGAVNAANTPTDTAGNTYIRVLSKNVAATFDLEIWYAKNQKNQASNVVTVTDTIGGANGILIVEEWTGADFLTVVDQSNSSTGTGSPITPGSITTRNPYDLIWVAAVEAVGASDLSAAGANSNLTQTATTFSNLGIASTSKAANGSFNDGFTSIVSVTWACGQVAIRQRPEGTTTSTSSTSSTSSSTSSTSTSISSVSTSSTSTSYSSTSTSLSTSSTSLSTSSTSSSTSSTSSSISSTSTSSTSSSTSISSTSSSISSTSQSSTSQSSTSQSSTSSSTSFSSISTSFSSTSSSQSSTSASTSSTSFSSTSSSSSTSTTAVPLNLDYTYEDKLTLPTTGADLTNRFTNAIYSGVAGDDGDYFIEYGSENMIRNYQFDNTNNTDSPTFTWRGRTTYDTRISPVLIQIYNVNSATWETLTTANTVPADTDFSVTVSQTTNVSNYYDASNIVTFRSYQKVI